MIYCGYVLMICQFRGIRGIAAGAIYHGQYLTMIRASCPHPDMWLTAILFNPTARVYNFRLVVLANVAFVILRGVRKLPLAGVIMAHHILALVIFQPPVFC